MAYAQMQSEEVDLAGGMDLVTPALSIAPGALIASQNYESDLNGGYRRMYGCERFDGNPSPSAQTYWNIPCELTAAVAVGATITGATSGATAIVLQVNATTEIIAAAVVGVFVVETITVSAANVGTVTGANQTAALSALLSAQYTSLAANYYRTLIGKVPGSGSVLGVKYFNGSIYAFRNNVGGTAAAMYKSTASGWSAVTFGRSMPFSQRTGVVTITDTSPGVVSFTKHGAANGTPVSFSTTGALPTGLVAGTQYYVVATAANTFEVAATVGGTAINTSSAGSGTHTATFGGIAAVAVGDTITGVTSGATAVVTASLLQSGTWTVSPVGSFVFATVTGGPFTNGEALTDSGNLVGQAGAADTAITLQPGGRFEFVVGNFGGQATTNKLYGCDGVNNCWEFDGTTFAPILTGISGDNPKFITVWMNMLVVALGSSVEVSGIGLPYSWTALTGSAELTLGDTCTGILPQVPNQTTGALAIFTLHKAFILYGTSAADFNLVTQSNDAGAVPYSVQNIGFAYFLDVKGAMQINTTKNYGNFAMAVLTRKVQSLINSKRGKAVASCIVRASNQMRIYYADGTGFGMFMTPQNTETIGGDILLGDVVGGIMYFDFSGIGGHFNTITSDIDTTGIERTFAGGSTGYVYELERGSSVDGANILSYIFTAFNSSKSPRNRKKYKRTALNVRCLGTANVDVGYNLSYGGQQTATGFQDFQSLGGTGASWDIFAWDSFVWDTAYVSEYIVDTPGNGINLGLIIYGNNAIDFPYTVQSAVLNYTIGRIERG